jgi:hypothetical protein
MGGYCVPMNVDVHMFCTNISENMILTSKFWMNSATNHRLMTNIDWMKSMPMDNFL